MITFDDLTSEQLVILHKVTLYKYGHTENLISQEEYNKLPDILKGYAYKTQYRNHKSVIQQEDRSEEWIQGYEMAEKEMKMRQNKPVAQ